MTGKGEQAKIAILKALVEMGGAAGATRIGERLAATGIRLRPRTVRFYLAQLDREGMTRFVARRKGREITERGREELSRANVMDKLGFVAAKVDTLGYRMSFRIREGRGNVVANLAFMDRRALGVAGKEMQAVFAADLGMGRRVAIVPAGESLGNMVVPEGQVAVGTVCSVTVNGVMLHEGIPVTSRFGGLLEMRQGRPVRFVELIEYRGTTLDPLEAFIKAGMTRVRECARSGSGIIGASLREVPSAAVDEARRIHAAMRNHGLGGILAVGQPNQPLLDIPVAEGRTGMIVVGGLNPVAAVHEAGVRVSMASLAGLEDIGAFLPFKEALRQDE